MSDRKERDTPSMRFSYVNDPAAWETDISVAFVCATNEDAKKAEALISGLQSELAEARELLKELSDANDEFGKNDICACRQCSATRAARAFLSSRAPGGGEGKE